MPPKAPGRAMEGRGSVLILGAHRPVATAAARSLHRRGIPVVVASVTPWESPISSRAIRHFATLPHYAESANQHLKSLAEVIDRWNVGLLLPVSDRALQTLAANHEFLSARVRLGCASPAAIWRVLDKWATMELAAREGVPIPTTRLARDEADLGRIRADLNFPVVAKIRDKARERQYVDVRHFESHEALSEAWRRESDFGGRFLVQEFIPGDDIGLAVAMHNGRAAAAFQYRAVRMFPNKGGYAVMTCSEPVSPELAGYAVAMLRALGVEGVAQVDFRRDLKTGRSVLLDVNARLWGSTAAAVHAGVDFPYFAWQLAHGLEPDAAKSHAVGMKVRWLAGDSKRLMEILRRENVGFGARLREFVRFVADFRPTVRGGLWSWTDPIPAWQQAWNGFRAIRLRVAGFG